MIIRRSRCFLCGRDLEPLERGLQRHPQAADCEVQYTDAWGISVELDEQSDEPTIDVGRIAPEDGGIVLQRYPFVDDVLVEAFESYGMPRLGGKSSGMGWTSFENYQRCPYLYKMRYVENRPAIVLVESPSRAIGSLIHAFLALYYRGMMEGVDGPTVEEVYERVRNKADPTVVAEAWRVFEAYTWYYQGEEIIPLAIEYDLKDPRTYESCRLDLIAFFPTEALGRRPGTYNIEHKSASRFDQDTIDGWQCNGEVLGQVALWKRLGLDKRFGELKGTIVNILGKQKEPKFHRTLVAPSSMQLAQHLQDLKRWEGLMNLSRSMDTWPRARNGCIGRYGRCDYYDHCAGVEPE
jgi:hypothetical protein